MDVLEKRAHLLIPVTDLSSVGEARRTALRLAEAEKFNAADGGRVSIIATELATNLVRHAGPNGGQILVAASRGEEVNSIEITSVDSGRGMSDVARCFEDGFSTAGTPGNGLGAVQRLSDEMDVFSSPTGTVLWTRVVSGGGTATQTERQVLSTIPTAGVAIPARGEEVCGDSWRLEKSDGGKVSLIIADGLGHGPLAAEASNAACKIFDDDPFAAPNFLIEAMHAAIAGTRGAAVAIARIDTASGKLEYVGVGNIAGTLLAPEGSSRGLFSHNGTVGHHMRNVRVFDYPWLAGSLLIMHSDGLQTRWSLDNYPGLARRHPGVIAGVLYRDARRGRDDISIVIVGSKLESS